MKVLCTVSALILIGSMSTSCAAFKNTQPATSTQGANAQRTVNLEALQKYASGWPEASQRAVTSTIERYGNPEEVTPTMLTWRNTAPFKRIVVFRDSVTHKFPMLHQDVIEHVIDYKVPVDKVEAISRFSGSILIDRTRGELSSRSDREGMNLLALNIVNDIVTGKRNTAQARSDYGKFGLDLLNGKRTTYSESLQFGGQFNTADVDRSIDLEFSAPSQSRKARQAQESEENIRKK